MAQVALAALVLALFVGGMSYHLLMKYAAPYAAGQIGHGGNGETLDNMLARGDDFTTMAEAADLERQRLIHSGR